MLKKYLAVLTVALISGCATPPAEIEPAPIDETFERTSCAEARALLQAENAALADLYTTQREAVAGDAIGVFLIGVPVASAAGDEVEDQIAKSKGKITALTRRLAACR